MNNEIWLKVLQKFAEKAEIPFSQVPKSVREKLQQWGDSSGAVSLQRSQAGAGRVFKVINLRIVEKEIVSLDPNVDVNSLSSSRLRNLAINKDTKAGATTLECSYYLCKAIGDKVVVDGTDKRDFYVGEQKKAADFAEKVHSGVITNAAGEKFTTVVQIGIGGSDLGPRAMYLALENWARQNGTFKMEARFISNVDPDDAASVLKTIDVGHSIFVLVSKSGTTLETLTNESFVKDALRNAGLDPSKHMVAVTSETSPLAKSSDYLAAFFMDDYIGGRYSSTSCVGGVVLSLAFGPEVFARFLDGAHQADLTAKEPELLKNPAMLDALIGVYERNVLGYPSTAVLPYSQALCRFPAHLQQLDMESNGKHVNRFGEQIDYPTGPVIFGEPGTNGQHSFYQLLHQGTDIVPLQFVGFRRNQAGMDVDIQGSTSQQKLCANVVAQIMAFACGKQDENPNKSFEGGRPSSIIIGEQLTPEALGALLAHFENKVMFQE